MNVELEKVRIYAESRLKRVKDIIQSHTSDNINNMSYDTMQMIIEEERAKRELMDLLNYINKIKSKNCDWI